MINENIRFLRKAFTLRRLVNAIKSYSSYLLSLIFRKPVVWGYPPVVMIEPTNICNLRCPLCPSGNGTLKREKGFMSVETFKKIINEIHKDSFMVVLWNQGEPFLNSNMMEMISYAAEKKMFSLLSTNGNIEVDAEELVKSGLDSLIVSLDGATQETYNKYRVNGRLSKVLNFARAISTAKHKLRKKNPLMRWQFLVMKHNEHEIEQIKEMAKEIKVDNMEMKTVQIYSKEDVEKFLPTNPRYRRYKIEGDNFELKAGIPNRCRRIWTNAVINWNGEMAVCCFDKDIDHKLGNIADNTVLKLWQGSSFQKFRQQILKNRKAYSICRNCGESVRMRVKQVKVN